MYCGNCGSEVTENMRFCGNCGSEVQQVGNTKTSPKKRFNLNNKALLIGGGVVIVLVAVLMLFVFNGEVNDSPKSAVEGLIRAGLEEDADLFLKVLSDSSVAGLEQDFRFSSDKYDSLKEALEEEFLREMHEDMARDGLKDISDVTVIEPVGYENKTRVRVKVIYGSEEEDIPVEKIDGKWYISFY